MIQLCCIHRAKVDVEYRLRVLKPVTSGDTMPSAPPLSGSLSNGARHEEVQWEDARTLISIEEGTFFILYQISLCRYQEN